MSDVRVAALVCEGQTDIPVFRALIQEVWPAVEEVRCLQPELDEMDRAKGPAGWTQVKAWCRAHAGRLDDVLAPDLGDPIDLLIVAIDVDIAIAAGIVNPPQVAGGYETPRLRQTIEGWLVTTEQTKLPIALQLSTPVMAIETWTIAALFRKERYPEKIKNPTGWLVGRKKLRVSPEDQKPWKELHLYRAWAPTIAKRVGHIRKTCPEADRTLTAVEERRSEVEKKGVARGARPSRHRRR